MIFYQRVTWLPPGQVIPSLYHHRGREITPGARCELQTANDKGGGPKPVYTSSQVTLHCHFKVCRHMIKQNSVLCETENEFAHMETKHTRQEWINKQMCYSNSAAFDSSRAVWAVYNSGLKKTVLPDYVNNGNNGKLLKQHGTVEEKQQCQRSDDK